MSLCRLLHMNVRHELELEYHIVKAARKMDNANAITTQGFEDRKNHSLLAMRSSNC